MSTLDGALLSDEASRPQRIFEGDLVVPLMSPWLALADLLRLAQTNRACMREISIGVREIGLTEFECPVPLTVRGTQALRSALCDFFDSQRGLAPPGRARGAGAAREGSGALGEAILRSF